MLFRQLLLVAASALSAASRTQTPDPTHCSYAGRVRAGAGTRACRQKNLPEVHAIGIRNRIAEPAAYAGGRPHWHRRPGSPREAASGTSALNRTCGKPQSQPSQSTTSGGQAPRQAVSQEELFGDYLESVTFRAVGSPHTLRAVGGIHTEARLQGAVRKTPELPEIPIATKTLNPELVSFLTSVPLSPIPSAPATTTPAADPEKEIKPPIAA